MANEIEAKTTSGKIATWLSNPQITQQIVGALAGYMDADTFRAQCALAARDPKLAECDPVSLFAAFLVCAQMGMLPGKHHGHVALIPRKVDGGNKPSVVDIMPQWAGFKFLMERQPGIRRVTPILVHVTDEFSTDGVNIEHRFNPFDERRIFQHPADGPTGLRGGYLRIEHEDGEVRYHFTSGAKIELARQCSQTPDLDKWNKPGVWRKWFPEQALKTVLRDAWARRAVSIDPMLADRLGAADAADNAVLGNDPTRPMLTAAVSAPKQIARQASQDEPGDAKEPTPEQAIVSTPAKAAEPVWSEKERKAFMAQLHANGCKYEDVAAWLESQGNGRPSSFTANGRESLLADLAGPRKAEFAAFLASKAPADPTCGVCGKVDKSALPDGCQWCLGVKPE